MLEHDGKLPCRKSACVLLGGGLLLAVPLRAQDAEAIYLTKSQNFSQVGPLMVGLNDEDFTAPDDAPFQFEAFIETPDSSQVSGATLGIPGGSMVGLVEDSPFGWQTFDGFPVFFEMESARPPGSYSLEVNTQNDGDPSVNLGLPATGYPGVTRFTVFDAAQAVNPASPFVFQWDPIPGGTVDDLVFLEVNDESGETVFESPDIGEPGQLTGLSTQSTLPGGFLDPGGAYSASLMVFRPMATDNGYPGVSSLSALGKIIRMPVLATGGSDGDPPDLISAAPSPGEGDVELNAIVSFLFDEPMDTTIDPGQAIDWAGLPDPSQFSYSWSPDGTRLFCNHGPGLPASTMVNWTLNPTGSSAKLRDAAGNPLADDLSSGDFTTGTLDNTGEADATTLEFGNLKSFRQDGPAPVDLGAYLAGFFVDLNGVATVSSVDLDIPGRGVATDIGELGFGGREIEGELGFAEAADLDRMFPAGDYTVTVHTAHDGIRNIPLTVGASDFPAAPTLLDFGTTQAVDSSQPFTLNWNPMAGGTASDYIELYVEGDFGCYFESPAPGEPGALDGTATSITIPADILPPGRVVDCELVFFKVVDTNSTAYPGVDARSVIGSLTRFQMQTTGEPFIPQLHLTHSGSEVNGTVIAEVGRFYEVRASTDLVDWFPVWSHFLHGDCNGYKDSFEFFDNVFGMPRRFYQVTELPPPTE